MIDHKLAHPTRILGSLHLDNWQKLTSADSVEVLRKTHGFHIDKNQTLSNVDAVENYLVTKGATRPTIWLYQLRLLLGDTVPILAAAMLIALLLSVTGIGYILGLGVSCAWWVFFVPYDTSYATYHCIKSGIFWGIMLYIHLLQVRKHEKREMDQFVDEFMSGTDFDSESEGTTT